jgi:hypothetical protein
VFPRSWLYARPDLCLEIGRLRGQEGQGRAPGSPPIPARQHASDASLARRLEAVNAEVRRLRQENQRLREQFAWALGERRGHAPRMVRLDDDRAVQLTRAWGRSPRRPAAATAARTIALSDLSASIVRFARSRRCDSEA